MKFTCKLHKNCQQINFCWQEKFIFFQLSTWRGAVQLVRQPLCLWIEEWRYVFARITQLMDDAILNFRLGKYSPNRRRESRQVIRAGNENVLHASFFSPLSTVAQYLALSFSPTHIPNTSFLRAQRTYPCSLFFSFSCYGLSGQQPHQIACKAIVFSKKAWYDIAISSDVATHSYNLQ